MIGNKIADINDYIQLTIFPKLGFEPVFNDKGKLIDFTFNEDEAEDYEQQNNK